MQVDPDEFSSITRSYLAVTNIPYYVDMGGRVFVEHTWSHDLIQHLQYLRQFSLAAPRRRVPTDTRFLVPLDEKARAHLKLIALPMSNSRILSLLQIPAVFVVLWRAIGQADIVHAGVAGWPYPSGWLAGLVAQLRGKKSLIIVESAPWRTNMAAGTSLRWRIEAALYERLARYFCSKADLSIYTQPAYLKRFHGLGGRPAYVAPASWINSESILDDARAESIWSAKLLQPVRFLFAGRLAPEKGVEVLLRAAEKLSDARVHGVLHIIGDGPLLSRVKSAQRQAHFSIKYFEPMVYGEKFLEFVQDHHALVVPTISDEQPRIVYDAAARAVPVLASDTEGLRPHVEDGRTGSLIPPGDSDALANMMMVWASKPEMIRKYGLTILSQARGKTHRAMHAQRSRLIARHLVD